MNAYALLALFSFLSYLFIGFYALHLNDKAKLNRLFFIYSLVAAVYCFAEFGYLQAESYENVFIWLKVRSFWVLTFAVALHFHLVFIRGKEFEKPVISYVLIYGLPLFLFLADIFTEKVTGTPVELNGIWTYAPPHDSFLYHLGGFYALSYILAMTGLTGYYYLKTRNAFRKTQTGYLLIADALVIGVVMLNTFVIKTPAYQHLHIDSVLTLGSNLVILYAIWRFRLMQLTPESASKEIVSSMTNFLILVNPDGKINTVNQACENLVGYQKDELEGIDPGILFENEIPTESREAIIRHKNGALIPVLLSVSEVPVTNRESGRVYIGAELTQIREAEKKLLHYAFQMEKTSSSLQQLTKVISHDLSESLRLMSVFSQLLNRKYLGKFDQHADEYISYISNESERIYEKINGLALHSSLETEANFSPVDTKEVVDNILLEMEDEVIRRRASIIIDPLPLIDADWVQFRLLFRHLLQNALKFASGSSPAEIHISARQDGDEHWLFSVRDNGIGIEKNYHNKIFSIFQRLNGYHDYPGVGIGLAICKKVVELHHGRIWVESELGKGSVFYILLPEEQAVVSEQVEL